MRLHISPKSREKFPRFSVAVRAGVLVAAVALVLYAVFTWRTRFTIDGRSYFSLFDDEMISLRYARNLAEGHGLVWNGGDAPVEGYTNLLWVLWMALIHVAGVPERLAPLVIVISGVVLLLALLLLTWCLTCRLLPGRDWLAVAAVALVGGYYPLVFWTLRGTEVALITLLVFALALLAFRLDERFDGWSTAGLAAVASIGVLTRTDFLVPALIVLGYIALRAPARRAAVVMAGFVTATLAAHTAFRLAYYGDPLPNTYYLKVSGIAPMIRLTRGLASLAHVELVELYLVTSLAVSALVISRGVIRARVGLLVGLFVGQLAYSVAMGGDAWEWMQFANRFVTPGAALAMIAAIVGCERIASGASSRGAGAIGSALLCLVVGAVNLHSFGYIRQIQVVRELLSPASYIVPFAIALVLTALGALQWLQWRIQTLQPQATGAALLAAILFSANTQPAQGWLRHNAFEVNLEAGQVRQGIAIRRATTGRCSVAVVLAGATPYFSRRRSIDLLGRNDRKIAREPPQPVPFVPGHVKWNYAYSIGELQPDVVVGLWSRTAVDAENMTRWGYDTVGAYYVRRGATCVDRGALRSFLLRRMLPPAGAEDSS